MYGLTETKRTLYLPPERLDKKPGSVGVPIPGTEAWLEDESGKRLGAHQTGELIVRGRHVMRGYWGDAELSAKRFAPTAMPGERVCRTGDLFRIDEDGFFYFVARKDDIIKSRGEKVAPKEVEAVLYTLPGVIEAAVFGVPDPLLGQAIKAVIATDGRELTRAQTIAHCRKHLEEFMVPKHVEFCSALPKSPSGKIQKRELTCAASPASAT
jgi:long-chain acyl-CoA synthetase